MRKIIYILFTYLLYSCSPYPNHPADMEEIIYNYCKDSIKHYGVGGDTLRLSKLTPFEWEYLDKYVGLSSESEYNRYLKSRVRHYCGEYDVVYLFINKKKIVDNMFFDWRKEKFEVLWNQSSKTSEEYEDRSLYPDLLRQDMTPEDANFYVTPRDVGRGVFYELEPVSNRFAPHNLKNIIYNYCRDSIKHYGIGGDTLHLARVTPFKWEYLNRYVESSYGKYNKYLKREIRYHIGEQVYEYRFINKECVVDSFRIDAKNAELKIKMDYTKKAIGKRQDKISSSDLIREVYTPKNASFYVLRRVERYRSLYTLVPID